MNIKINPDQTASITVDSYELALLCYATGYFANKAKPTEYPIDDLNRASQLDDQLFEAHTQLFNQSINTR